MFSTVKNVAKHSLIYGLGDMMTKLVAFILIPLYTHYITTDDYGALELINLCSYIVGFIIAMGISQSVVRFYFDFDEEEKQHEVISVALISVWVLTVLGFILLYSASDIFSGIIFQSEEYTALFRIMFATLAVTTCSEIPLDYMRIKQESLRYISVSMVRVFFTLVLNIVFIVYYGLGVQGILLGGLLANLIVGSYLVFFILKRIRLSFSVPLLKKMLAYSLPLIWSWIGGFMMHFSDRFLLQRLATLSDVGVYALGYKFGLLLNVLVYSPFSKSWAPKQFEIANEKDAPKTFARIFTYLCFLQFFVTLGISVIISDLLRIISEESYHGAARYVPLLLVAYNFNGAYHFIQFALLQKKRTGLLAIATLGCGIFNIALNLFLIPSMGPWGATLTTLVSFALLFGITYVLAQRLFYIPLEFIRLGKMIFLGLLLYFCIDTLWFDNAYLGVLLRGLAACTFPLLLFPLGFYGEDEKEKLKEFTKSLKKRFA